MLGVESFFPDERETFTPGPEAGAPSSLPQNRPRRRAVRAENFQRETHEFILARLHLRKIEAFDDPHFRAEQDAMAFDAVLLPAAHAQVIHTNDPHAAFD